MVRVELLLSMSAKYLLPVFAVALVHISGAGISDAIDQAPPPPSSAFLLSAGKAGPLELGQSVDEVYRLVGRERVRLVDLFKEGLFSPALDINLPGSQVSPALVADIREWPCGEFSVWGIDVRDPRFRTRDGFGVGSMVGELRQKYQVQLSHEEGESAVVAALQMTFGVNGDAGNDLTRATAVWIWPDPEGVRKRRCPGR